MALSSPILLVIDALDESGDASGKVGLHTFLANISPTSHPNSTYWSRQGQRMVSNLRSPKRLEKQFPPDVFKDHGVKLAKAAEGLFQWAAVASGFIYSPPAIFGYSQKKCVQRLMGHSRSAWT